MLIRHAPACVVLAAALASAASQAGEKGRASIVLENELVRYTIGADARNLGFLDRLAGAERAAAKGKWAFARLRKGGAWHNATACSLADGKLTLTFAKPAATAVVRATCKPRYFVFELESLSDPAVDELALVNLAVTPCEQVSWMSGVASDGAFAAAVRALNLRTRGLLGGRPPVLAARSYGEHGHVGAKVALVGCPSGRVRAVLQEVVRGEGLPWSPLGGPFALDAEETRGSYVFARVSEANVDEWVALAKRAGIAQVHLNGWATSLGHYTPRKNLFPNGLAGLKACVDKLHAAGLKAGMHTLTGCISPRDPWATPVPDKRLAVDASFTLAAAVDAKATTLPTVEPPGEFDTVWAYGSRGNALRVGDELVQFTGLSRQPPYGFTGCKRGAFGTTAAAHAKGAEAGHLFVRYGAFQPDPDSTLVDEVAGVIANVFNTCGFDMIYMDGAEGMAGGWRGVATMRAAIFRKLRRRALVEASSWGTPSWVFHSRIGAWDHPKWALKRFVDVHCRSTERYRASSLLPAQLGWWAILGPGRDWRAEQPDEIEYLCAKALALDAPMSLQAVTVGARPPNARQDEYLDLIGRYERLRLAGYFSDAVKQRLRVERHEFRLEKAPDGQWQFLPTDYATHKVTALDDGSAAWTVANRFAAQPAALRLEALYSVEPYDSEHAVVLADFAKEDEFADPAAAKGIRHALAPTAAQVKVGAASGLYTAENPGKPRRGTWARVVKTFEPTLNLGRRDAMGLWVHGDGKGELLNLQLTSPRQFSRGRAEHYVKVDFTGWRYIELLLRERDAEAFGDYAWPYGGIYDIYRSPLARHHVRALSLYLNHLPPQGSVACALSPIKALRTAKATLRHPRVTVGGRTITFPVELTSGSSIDFRSMTDCVLRDARGAVVQQVRPQGEAPTLAAGDNAVTFACDGPPGLRARAEVTLISHGPPLRGRAPTDKIRWHLLPGEPH